MGKHSKGGQRKRYKTPLKPPQGLQHVNRVLGTICTGPSNKRRPHKKGALVNTKIREQKHAQGTPREKTSPTDLSCPDCNRQFWADWSHQSSLNTQAALTLQTL